MKTKSTVYHTKTTACRQWPLQYTDRGLVKKFWKVSGTAPLPCWPMRKPVPAQKQISCCHLLFGYLSHLRGRTGKKYHPYIEQHGYTEHIPQNHGHYNWVKNYFPDQQIGNYYNCKTNQQPVHRPQAEKYILGMFRTWQINHGNYILFLKDRSSAAKTFVIEISYKDVPGLKVKNFKTQYTNATQDQVINPIAFEWAMASPLLLNWQVWIPVCLCN